MHTRFRPIHSGFETLRLAGMTTRSTGSYHRFGSATNEQMTASAYARRGAFTRPSTVFADFKER